MGGPGATVNTSRARPLGGRRRASPLAVAGSLLCLWLAPLPSTGLAAPSAAPAATNPPQLADVVRADKSIDLEALRRSTDAGRIDMGSVGVRLDPRSGPIVQSI